MTLATKARAWVPPGAKLTRYKTEGDFLVIYYRHHGVKTESMTRVAL